MNEADKATLSVALKEFLINPICRDAIVEAQKSGISLEDIKIALENLTKTTLEKAIKNIDENQKLNEVEKEKLKKIISLKKP